MSCEMCTSFMSKSVTLATSLTVMYNCQKHVDMIMSAVYN